MWNLKDFLKMNLKIGLICNILIVINAELTPPYFNLATGRNIYSTATCGYGIEGPELYCKLVGANTENEFVKDNNYSLIHGQVCDYCDPTNSERNHPPENAIDGTESWWQSPPLSRGMKYNEVNLTIDFGQEFHVAYLFLRMGNSPRPGLWTLEKSSDYGKTWSAWQHFSDTPADCETYFGRDSYKPITNDDDVVCTTDYSKIVPLENGEIPVMLLKDRPSSNAYFNSSVLQEWTRATNVRIRLLRTKNLLGHLMSVARQDPTVTRRYFYSIKDISIGGRCMCNGHASTCDVLDAKSHRRILACRCQHRTCGIQCNECCSGFEQKKWRQNTKARPFQCEPCNCHGHSSECKYNETVDLEHKSLDIDGKYDGGGVCQNCQHNTEGINCNKCIEKFYRPYGKQWNETDVCRPCDCDSFNLTGNCHEFTGTCECKTAFQPPNCDSCAYGYFGYPNCRECECNLNGIEGYHCEAVNKKCPCKINFAGNYCKKCAEGYYAFPNCTACACNGIGSVNNECDLQTGQCLCKPSFGGHNCEICKHGYYSYPTCKYCDCDNHGTEEENCNKTTGKCLCREGFGGSRCDQCLPGFYNYPDCVPCNCSSLGSTSTTCDATGKCNCLANFAGKQCTLCSAGYFNYPECLPCNCDSHGSEGISCNSEGLCLCLQNFDGRYCSSCKEGYYNFPACEECNCDPAGVIARFAGCGSVPAGELCQCKQRVAGRICNQCKPLYWNLNISNSEGCELCDCHLDGTVGALDTCDSKTGQCTCKPSVKSRQCRECKDGSFDLNGGSLFGCRDCDCDIGGARNGKCDKLNGQCSCHPRVTGRTCTQPLTTHYFPTLYQFQFEYEDGYTSSGAHVRYQYEEEKFPDFSGKGYAVFSDVQNKVINEITVFKSSVYRLVIRYVNPTDQDIIATILIQSDNPSEVDQTTKVLFKPSLIPQFVTVSGAKGDKPSPIVLDPGRYTISVSTTKNIKLDYFVILPAAYYEASILTRKIENPCKIGNLDLCRLYKYPAVTEFKPASISFMSEGDKVITPTELYDDIEHLMIIGHTGSVPAISDDQRNLKYLIDVPHTGRYVIVIDYVTNQNLPETYFVKIRISDDTSDYGTATLYTCLYSMACRQPVLDAESREKLFFIDVTDLRPVEVYHEHDDFGQVGILQVTAIPVEQWSVDFIQPSPVCVIHDRECAMTKFRSAPDSKKIEFEFDHEDKITMKKPPYAVFDDNIKLIYIDKNNASIEIQSKVSEPGRYVILVKYYQPNHPRYTIPSRLDTDKQNYDMKFEVKHCPSSLGCRGVIRPEGDNTWFDIDDGFKFTLTNNRHKGVWIDYFLIVPVDQYTDDLLQEEPFDQTQEFIQKCGQDHFYVPLNASDFCKKAVFSLTSDYNHGALPCNCHYDGSTSFECDPYGGQCQCKANIIGRHCDACRTGFYGFPDCKPCDCPKIAVCEKNTGECLCPTHVTGEKCDQCEPFTYGFHQVIGCEECNCNAMGVQNNNMQCDLHNGTCDCRPNIKGRSCDKCIDGYYNFPNCGMCNCNTAGTIFEVCDKHDGSCFCKKNVIGKYCSQCLDGTYNLQSSNSDGCTTCFCFGKTTRCDAAYLRSYNVSLLKNVSINDQIIDDDDDDPSGSIKFEPWEIDLNDILINETTLQADFSYKKSINGFVYFGVLDHLLNQNNHLTAYGGFLTYTLYYTTGPFGKALIGPDVILSSKEKMLIHENYNQPANAQNFYGSIEIVESNFQTIDKKPATRDDLMVALRDLDGIYIKANYWEQTVLSQLSDVVLTMADEDPENYNLYKELAVEKCHCPPGYSGFSCEDCAPGYYRDPEGPFGGYCIPCQCNGHTDTCDCNTGICKDCTHSTTGDHCEMCIEGYYGNATFGTPHDCMICPCPLPFDSNNFATSCEISTSGNEIHCECKNGYTGARCQSCAAGFYGDPEQKNDYCKPCECSGNINPEDFGSCDTITGKCLNCLNNTFGPACNLCAPGFYGDAVKLKDCKSCDCNDLGTLNCDPFVGTCICHDNVIGEQCNQCEPDHYGFDSGMGCRPCDCGIASNSTQCDDHSGECPCKSGVTGRQCDRCAVDYWNYTDEGCTQCRCNKGYSRGFGCNSLNGQCECLPGVIGEKCDNCPHRWVLIKDQGCSECDVCHHGLLDVTDRLQSELAPIIKDFDSVALAYFTGQKLNFYNDLTDKLEPQVKALDPNGVNMTPAVEALQSLELDTKNLAKQLTSAQETAKQSSEKCQKLSSSAKEVLDKSRIVNLNTRNTIKEVQTLSESFDTSASVKGEAAITEAQMILDNLQEHAIGLDDSKDQLNKAGKLYNDIELTFKIPVSHQSDALNNFKKDIGVYKNKLNDLNDWSKAAMDKCNKVDDLNRKNKITFENSKFDTVENQAKETAQNIEDTKKFILNGELTLETINKNLDNLKDTYDDLTMANKHVDEMLPEIADLNRNLTKTVEDSANKAYELTDMANNLSDQYSYITSDSGPAIKAANAYSDIVQAVIEAQKAVKNSKYAAGNATVLGEGIKERAGKSDQTASELLTKARDSLTKVQTDLQPHLDKSADNVKNISKINEMTEKKLNDINLALEQVPSHSQQKIWNEADKAATEANDDAQDALRILAPLVNQIPHDLETAKNMSKDIDSTNTDINETTKQVDRVKNLIPQLQALVDSLNKKQEATEASGKDLGDRIDKLKRQIEMARGIANSIKVGVQFMPTTVLELKTPETLPLLAKSSKVSTYFNTKNPNGFLMYLGNENRTGSHHGKNEDFLALELENGYPVLTVDLGDGPEKIINPKYVADNKWYQVIVERVGNNVQLNIREELENGASNVHSAEKTLPGSDNVFSVDKNSRLFVGGYPPDFSPPKDLSTSSFQGEIEDLKIGDEEVGLWNFVDAQDNNLGAQARDKLVTKEAPPTGFRFNGNGYVILDSRPYNFKQRSSIQFEFKASKDNRNGLLFYAGKHRHFISIELRNCFIEFKYKLGQHLVLIGEEIDFCDNKWHRIEANREGRRGLLKVDGEAVSQEEAPLRSEENLKITEHLYVGGYPGVVNHTEVIDRNFDGCIDKIVLSGINVDLSRTLKTYGTRPGCPQKFSTSLSFRPQQFGYLKQSNVTSHNNFQINFKFRTKQRDGIIFYASNFNQSSTIGMTINDGVLVLRSMKYEISSGEKKYNDGEWHVVTAQHDDKNLRLTIDDIEDIVSPTPPPILDIANGDIYFGGLPKNFMPVRYALFNLAYFVGCINDVTLNGQIINFASSTDKISGSYENCPSDLFDYDANNEPLYYPGDDFDEGISKRNKSINANKLIPIPVDGDYSSKTTSTTSRPYRIKTTTTEQFDNMETTILPQTMKTTIPPTTTPTTTTTTETIVHKPARTKRPLPPEQEEPICKLPTDPDFDVDYIDGGYRFIAGRDKRVEINSLPVKIKRHYDISLEFRTDESNGLLFYASDSRHTDFIAVFLKNGQINHIFSVGRTKENFTSTAVYNDGEWHKIEFGRQTNRGSLKIDDGESIEHELSDKQSRPMALQMPIYIGGTDPSHEENVNINTLLDKNTYYNGCIKNVLFSNRQPEVDPIPHGVVPCSNQNEHGTFFGKKGGFVKLHDHYRVAQEFQLTFDFKPRTTDGIIFSVHGKRAYLILELYNNTLLFSVQNDEDDIIDAVYSLGPGESFCDGQWRTVQAIKSIYVITLTVNGVSSQPAIGNTTKQPQDTSRAFFMGGHPYLSKIRGLKSRKYYHGCIRNLKIKETRERIKRDQIKGDVWPGMCPLN